MSSPIRIVAAASCALLAAALATAQPALQQASVTSTGTCIRSLLFAPDGAGGYGVTTSGNLLDPTPGVPLALTDDNQLSGPVDIGFAFPFPGGRASQLVSVDSNGRILIDGTETASDPTPTTAELLGEPWPVVACWSDFNLRGGGEVTLSTLSGGSASLTWSQVPQFGGTNGHTFQIQLFPNGSVIVVFVDFSGFNREVFRADDLLVGLSSGSSAPDPGESDFSTGSVHALGRSEVYELFEPSRGERFDLQSNPRLFTLTLPHIGSAWHTRVWAGVPGESQAAFLVGFTRINVDLGFLGLEPGCALLTEPVFVAARPLDAQGTASIVFSVPSTSMHGLEVFVQVVTDALRLSNRLNGKLGI